ncbi:MAG TPA: DUF2243 domain-containing protein [Herpetosiphonaceae bacterium]|nr:DUF2243 domain-containing protein [Herpetosiphonaceae bacterium]
MTERERIAAADEPAGLALETPAAPAADRRQVAAGVLLGIGLGGLFDGIVLHQILQWHHLVSAPYPPTSLDNLEINTLADGLFHAATWLATLAGVLLLAGRRGGLGRLPAPRVLVGSLLAGWGAFNLVEGIVDHHLLGLHHVRPGPGQLWWDLGFLAWGALMLLGGIGLLRSARR